MSDTVSIPAPGVLVFSAPCAGWAPCILRLVRDGLVQCEPLLEESYVVQEDYSLSEDNVPIKEDYSVEVAVKFYFEFSNKWHRESSIIVASIY